MPEKFRNEEKTNFADFLAYLSDLPELSDQELEKCFGQVKDLIVERFLFSLDSKDTSALRYVHKAFAFGGLKITYDYNPRRESRTDGLHPKFSEIILKKDQYGRQGNFLISKKDYQFVRGMHLNNRIIPIVGDFAGTRALRSIARYLKENNYIVSAFYVSNVEYFLFQEKGVYEKFLDNVRALPIGRNSIFIRSSDSFPHHPMGAKGDRWITVLQYMPDYLSDQKTTPYTSIVKLFRYYVKDVE